MRKNSFAIDTPGGTLAATLYTQDADVAAPVVILCHGFCGIQPLLVPDFAEYFAARGLHAITFDYRGFGASAGERGRLVPEMQVEDIGQVIDWAARQPFAAGGRIGLWGTSLGGAHVIAAAAREPRVRAVVSQMAFGDGYSLITHEMDAGARAALEDTLAKMQARKQASGKEMMVPINRVLTDSDSRAFFEEVRGRHPEIDIRIPFLTVQEMLRYRPVEAAAEVRQPVLVVAAEADIVNPPEQARLLHDALAGPKAWHLQPGARHYDLYAAPHFEPVAERQHAWFAEHLAG